MESQNDRYGSAPVRVAIPVRRGVNLQVVFVLLMGMTIVLGLTVWRLSSVNNADIADSPQADTSRNLDTLAGTGSDDPGVNPREADYETTESNATSSIRNADSATSQQTDANNASSTARTSDDPEATIPTSSNSVPLGDDNFGPPTLSSNSTVSTVGLDTVTFGMTVQQAQQAAGTLMVPISPVSDCYHVTPHNAPEGIVFLVDDGTIERVDITAGPITTRSGVGVGTPDDAVIRLFGDSIKRSARPDGTVNLTFVPSDDGDNDFRVVFNVTDGKVSSYKSGRVPQVLAATGCDAPESAE